MNKNLILFLSLLLSVYGVAQNQGAIYDWAKTIDQNNVSINDIIEDNSGNIYLTGTFQGTVDFNAGAGVNNLVSNNGSTDAFIIKYNDAGNFIWAKQIGSDDEEESNALAIDNSKLYIGGAFSSLIDFDPGASAVNITSAGDKDAFILVLDLDGNYVTVRTFFSHQYDAVQVLSGSSDYGTVVFGGVFAGNLEYEPAPSLGVVNVNLSVTPDGSVRDMFYGSIQTDSPEPNEITNFRKSSHTSSQDYEPVVASIDFLEGDGIAITGQVGSNVNLIDSYGNTGIASPNSTSAFTLILDGTFDYQWMTLIGSESATASNGQEVNGVIKRNEYNETTQNSEDFYYIAGTIYGDANFEFNTEPTTGFTVNASSNGDAFIAKYTESGTRLWVERFSGAGAQSRIKGISIIGGTDSDPILISGDYTGALNFNPKGDFVLSNYPVSNSFIAALDSGANLVWAKNITQNGGENVSLGFNSFAGNSILTTGRVQSKSDMNTEMGVDSIGSTGLNLPYFHKMNICMFQEGSVSVVSCDPSYTWAQNGETYTENGRYSFLKSNLIGCDSLITLDLTLATETNSSITIEACDSFTVPSGDETYTASSVFYDTIPNALGCDSVILFNLTIINSSAPSTDNDEVCYGESYTFHDGFVLENIIEPVSHESVLTNVQGCDSVITTTLSILNTPNISFDISNASCGEENGAVNATVTNGNSFTYSWNNGSDNEDLQDIGANIYVLTATNELGCATSAQANVLSSEITISGDVIDNSCIGLTSGSINLTLVGNATPYTFQWTNGADTEDISSLGAGVYEVIVTDANDCQSSASFEVSEPDAFEFESVVTLASCGTSNGAIDLTVSGGNGSYDFDWVDASNTNVGNTEDLSSIPQGLYTVTVTDANGCTASYQTNVSENGAPEIILDSFYVASCLDDGALFTSINSPNTIQSITWSNAETSDDITNLAEGSYSVSVEDNLGCVGTAIFEVPSAIPSATQICLVTVDQNTNTNLVVWEKPVSTDISSFVIYRESSVGGTYQALDTVPYADLSEYTDPNAFPHIRSWKYRIGTINTCGVESQLSSIHKTVHCAINAGLNGVYNIYWDNYSGFNYTTFEVWRHTTSNGWEEIESLAVGNNSYTDTPPETNGLDYYVAVSAPSLCSSSKANDYNTSRSNRTAGVFEPIDSTINVLDYESLNIQISPNPFNETLFIEGLENQTVKLFDIQGKLVKTAKLTGNQVKGLGGLEHGVYLLEVMTSDKRIVRIKLIKK